MTRLSSRQLGFLFFVSCFYVLGPTGAEPLTAQSSDLISVKLKSPVLAIETTTDRIIVGSGNSIHILSTALKTLDRVRSELDYINDLVVDGDFLYAAGGSPSEHGMIEKYSLKEMKLLSRKIVHKDVVSRLVVGARKLISSSTDSTIKTVDKKTLRPLMTYANHSKRVTTVLTLADGRLAVSAGLDDTLRLWDLQTGKTIRTLTHHQDDVLALDARMSDDQASLPMIASVSRDQTIRFWQPTIGRMVRFKKLDEIPTTCCWLKTSDEVLVGTDRGQVLRINSIGLETSLVAELEQRIYSAKILDKNRVLVGTSRGIYLIRF